MPEDDVPLEDTLLEGFISVSAALQGGRRVVQEVLIRADKQDGQTRHLEQLARLAQVAVTRVPAETIEAQAGGKTHGGVLARVGPYRFAELGSLTVGKTRPFLAMVDGVEDPFNFGASVRAL